MSLVALVGLLVAIEQAAAATAPRHGQDGSRGWASAAALTIPPGTDIPVTLDARGVYTINLNSNNIPPGSYKWRLRGVKYLANCGTVVIPACPPAITNLEHGTLRAGDINGDNLDNASDFTRLKNRFGQACTCPEDLNNDGIVNTSDFNFLKLNFGQGGCAVLP